MFSLKKSILFFSSLLLGYSTASANLIIYMQDVGNDVQFTASGSFNFSADDVYTSAYQKLTEYEFWALDGSGSCGILNESVTINMDEWFAYKATGLSWAAMSSVTGDSYGFNSSRFYVPLGYVAGTKINNVAVVSGKSLSDWGFDENTSIDVTMTYSGGVETMTFTTSPVPEPSSYAFFAGAAVLLFVGLFVGYRRKIRK